MENNETESYKKAGEIARQVVDYAKSFIVSEVLLIDIADKIDEKIEELGGKPAFPVNLSLNEIAAHYTPSLGDETKAEGLLKVDIGVEVDGYIADTAFSLDLTDEKKFQDMIDVNEKILSNTIEKINIDSVVGDVGTSMQEELDKSNDRKGEGGGKKYILIKNLSGHSLDSYDVHSGVTVSNYKNGNGTPLKDMAIAIEPFLTTGKGEIYEGGNSEIYMLQGEGQVRDNDARELLKFIKEEYRTKPFCKRWLDKKDFKKVAFSLSTLTKQGILHNFPVLIEKNKQPVSQAEHTIIISNEGISVTTL